MALITVVKFSELGSCWHPARFTSSCARCSRYHRCTYPERVPDITYDSLIEKRKKAYAEYEKLAKEVKQYSVKIQKIAEYDPEGMIPTSGGYGDYKYRVLDAKELKRKRGL